jgi:hypothetical protein
MPELVGAVLQCVVAQFLTWCRCVGSKCTSSGSASPSRRTRRHRVELQRLAEFGDEAGQPLGEFDALLARRRARAAGRFDDLADRVGSLDDVGDADRPQSPRLA